MNGNKRKIDNIPSDVPNLHTHRAGLEGASRRTGETVGWDFCVRRMCPEDIPAVAALEQKTFSEPWSEKGFADALRGEQNIFLVAERGTNLIGYIGLYGSFDEGDITNVAVGESCRARGVGLALVNHMKERAYGQGIRHIFLEVRASNVVARHLYEKAGFMTCGLRKNFYRKPSEDAVLMSVEMTVSLF